MKLNLPEYTKTKYWCKSYPKGFPSDVTIPRVGLPQLIEDAVRENHGRVAMLTHQNIVANIVQNRPYWVLMEKKDGVRRPVVMSVLPWYHIYGQTVDLSTALCLGGTLVVLPHFEAELVL